MIVLAATYEPIATTTLGTATASVSFTSISGSFTDLVLITNATFTSGENGFQLTFNSDGGNNYSTTYLYGDGSNALSTRVSNGSNINAGRQSTTMGVGITHIMNYSNTTTNKTVLTRGNSSSIVNANVGLWRNTGAITSLTCTAEGTTFTAGSTFTLYGIAAA